MSEISVFMKETPGSSFASFCYMRIKGDIQSLQPRSGSLSKPGGAGTLILDCQPPEQINV